MAPGSPTVEPLPGDRFRVTVSYRDEAAECVEVAGGLAGADPADRRMRRRDGGRWERSYDLPGGVRCGYWFETPAGPVADPLNPRVHVYPPSPTDPDDPGMTVSLIELPGAPPRRWSLPREGGARGRVQTHRLRSERLRNERAVFTYTPPGYDAEAAYPLVVAFDGWAWIQDAYLPLPTVLDNLIAAGAIPPVVAVLPDSLDRATRLRELHLDEGFVSFVADELLPWAQDVVSYDGDPSRTLVAGASLGGLAAAFCGVRRPETFGLVLAQSAPIGRALATAGALPRRVALQVGGLETVAAGALPSTLEANRSARDVLATRGCDVVLTEYAGGHDYFWWRETVAEGLVALLASL